MSAEPQVCKTERIPMRAPRCFGIGRDGEHGLGRSLEQDTVDCGLVLVGDIGDLSRQREHDVEVGTGKSSASRSASHSRAAAPWHFGQCLLRQVMGDAH